MPKKHELPRIVLRREQGPLQLRGEVGAYLPPGARYEYRPPSVFAQYRLLSAVFALVVLATLAYWALAPGQARRQGAGPTPAVSTAPGEQPVYVEPIQPR